MLQKAILSMFILLLVARAANAQYVELLGLAEKEVLEKVKDYPVIVSRTSAHEPGVSFLQFKNREHEVKLFCSFFVGRCSQVIHYAPLSGYDSVVNFANRNFEAADNKWISRDSTFTLTIRRLPDKVAISYSRGVSRL